MPWTSKHLSWLKPAAVTLESSDGKPIEVFEFVHKKDEAILSDWAKHFRNHYCLDSDIDGLRAGTRLSRSEYLNQMKFPDRAAGPGPGIRSGDFGEILVADYLEYVLKFSVPRTRYASKTIRNESTKGCDVIGFKILRAGADSDDDTIALFESKAQMSGDRATARLQDAVNDSVKDHIRKAESLNAIKQFLRDKQRLEQVKMVERFQDIAGRPHKELYGAAAVISTAVYDPAILGATSVGAHPGAAGLKLIVIHGADLLALAHELYDRAANEA
jgi:hypothetical protein